MANKVLCYPPVRTQWGRGAGNTEAPRGKGPREADPLQQWGGTLTT